MLESAILSLLLTAGGATSALPPARDLGAAIENRGPARVLDELWSDTGRWGQLMDSIATGRPEWLAIGVRLHAVSDAGASEELESAFLRALAAAPERVLPLLRGSPRNGPWLRAVCSGVMLAEDEDETYMRAWSKKTERVLRAAAPATPIGRQNRAKCLAFLLSDFPKFKFR